MSVRVVARIRPLLEKELDKDIIVRADSSEDGKPTNVVKIPSPKNEAEEFSFTFNSVYDLFTTQETLFTSEVAPHVKSLFQGLDVTIFAYGVTGTGKTHTMRGGMKLAERGVIPRLLSAVFRRGKKIAKDTGGNTAVSVALSYYEIYNDKVFDLLEPPEKRTASGLPLREKDNKTIVVGLSERACGDLKDFERLYIEANTNRVTAATKLNAHSSRSHAILRVKVTQTTGDTVRESTASAIDLAGSEDNRRTENGKERLVESAAINKSLFVLSQCIDAISRGDKRIPYRESKMTRILSLGQNNGITIMILNLAPLRSYHLDTLSSLNVSSRAKRIEVREIENEVVYKQFPRTNSGLSGPNLQRQPLRPLANVHNAHNVHTGALAASKAAEREKDKPTKAFSVYTDRSRTTGGAASRLAAAPLSNTSALRRSSPNPKRKSEPGDSNIARPSKLFRPTQPSSRLQAPLSSAAPAPAPAPAITAAQLEAMVERKVQEVLAARAEAAAAAAPQHQQAASPLPPQTSGGGVPEISEAVQRRLEELEKRIDDSRPGSDGLRFLLLAKQQKELGDDEAALRSYEMALPFFPGQAKLLAKMERLRAKLARAHGGGPVGVPAADGAGGGARPRKPAKKASRSVVRVAADDDHSGSEEHYETGGEADVDDESFVAEKPSASRGRLNGPARRPRVKANQLAPRGIDGEDQDTEGPGAAEEATPLTPRKQRLLDIVNSRDLALIRGLAGFGAKKAQDLVENLDCAVTNLSQLRAVHGMGGRTVERAYEGLVAQAL